MANGMNRVFLMGNVGSVPELKFPQSENPLLTFSLATNHSWKDKNGEPQERTEWHHIAYGGNGARGLSGILRQGERVVIEGRIETRSYDDASGKRSYWTEVRARNVFLTGSGRRDADMAERPLAGRRAPTQEVADVQLTA